MLNSSGVTTVTADSQIMRDIEAFDMDYAKSNLSVYCERSNAVSRLQFATIQSAVPDGLTLL
jgi:hypothetical protein